MSTVVLIGATSGLGREAARQLGHQGHRLILVGRDERRGASLVSEIGRTDAPLPLFVAGDVSTGAGVTAVARAVKAETDRVDVLVNNAGVMCQRRTLTDEGMELNFAVHHLAPFSMTAQLMPLLRRAGGRVINTNSVAHQAALFTPGRIDIDFDDLQSEHYSPYLAYSVSKLANLLFTLEFHRWVPEVPIAAVHPGMVRSRLTRSMHSPGFWLLSTSTRYLVLRSPQHAGRVLAWLATTDDLRSGAYYDRYQPSAPSAQAQNRRTAARLWQVTESLRGPFPSTASGRRIGPSTRP